MYSLARFSLLEMTECSAVLRQLAAQSTSLQDAAARVVRYLHGTLGDPETGRRDCVLVRCFKTVSYARLDAPTRQLARERLGGLAPFPDLKCFTLFATAGDEEDWNHVERSYRYRAIPLVNADFVKQFPMFSQLLHQFGVSTATDVTPHGEWLTDIEEKSYNVFYVPEAQGSPYVPMQDAFVRKYGVQSVLCFGGMLPSRDLFAIILFSKTSVSRETATLSRSLALSVKTSFLAFDEAVTAESDDPSSEPPVVKRHAAEIATAEQLLRVYEDAVRTQSAGITRAQQAVRERAEALERSERTLHEQTQIVTSIVGSMGDGVVVTDGAGQLVLSNPAVAGVLGFAPGPMAPTEWPLYYPLFHADAVTPWQRQDWPLVRALSGRTVEWVEVYIRTAGATPGRWVSINARAIVGDGGTITGMVAVFHDITWLKQAQEALVESEDRFRSVVEGARDIIFTIALDGTITSLNPAFESGTGRQRAQWVGSLFVDLLHPDDVGFCQDVLQAIAERGAPLTCSMQLSLKAGGYLMGEFVGTPQIRQGRVVGVLGFIRDVTARRRIEDALRVSEERLRSIVQSTPDAVILVTGCTKIAFWNKAAEEIFGYSAEDAIGQPLMTMVEEPSRPALEQHIQGLCVPTGSPLGAKTVELVGLRKDGARFPLEAGVTSWKGKADQFFTVIMRDITERRTAEEQLDRLHRHNQVVLHSAGEGIYGVDRAGRLTFVNPAAAQMFGRDPQALIGQSLHELVHAPDLHDSSAAASCPIMEAITGGHVQEHVDGAFRRADGTSFPVEYVSTPIKERGDTVGAVVVFQDMTDRKRTETQLQETLSRLRTLSRRMEGIREEERGRIARELHDELGVGLTCLKIDLSRLNGLFGEQLPAQDRAKIEDKVRGMKEQVDDTITSVQRIVAELRPGVLDDLGLVAAIEWQCRDFQRRTGIACRCTVSHEDLRVDREQATAVFRICQEALTNITRHAKATQVEVRLEEQGNGLILEVEDNGCGISPQRLGDAKSFGLLGMRERADLLGGTIHIDSREGDGTKIQVRLPR